MTANPHPNDEKYAGASPAVVSLGHGGVVGWIGSAAGAGIGAVASNFFNVNFFKGATAKLAKSLEKFHITVTDRLGVILSGIASGWIIGHYVGVAIGIKRGAEVANEGPEQFKRITGKLHATETELAQIKEQIGGLNQLANPEKKSSHAERIAAEKAETAKIVR